MDTPKISKHLRLMKLLTGNVSRTIREAGRWVLRTTVQALEGVGRFVIGLAADVKVVEGKKLQEYIKKYDKTKKCLEQKRPRHFYNTLKIIELYFTPR